jgi:hypothetical protein
MPPPKRREKAVVVARNETPATQPSAVEPKAAEPPAAAVPQPSEATKPANPVPAEPTQPPRPAAPQTAETPAPPPPALPPLEAPPPAEPRVPHTVTITAGTALPVRIGETISSARNQSGDSFLATLEQPLVVEGFIIAERGARIEGRVTDAEPAGRARGVSHLSLALVRLATADGQNIRIRTEPYKKEGVDSTESDVAKIGAGAAIGAAIGAIAGGGKGAAIGAGVGGAAGAGGVLLTHGKPVEIPVESRLSFRIQDPVTITERLD